jgi:hypothetical protein
MLGLGAIYRGCVYYRRLGGLDIPVLESGEELLYVARHRDVQPALSRGVVYSETAVFLADVVDVEDVAGIAKAGKEMLLGRCCGVCDCKIVDDQDEGDAVVVVAVNAGDESVFVIAILGEVVVEAVLGEAACVRNAEDGLVKPEKNLILVDEWG